MKTSLVIGLFISVCFLQIIAPLSMIAKREAVLKHGAQCKFKVAPVDPYDAFRGRYVALRFEEDYVKGVKQTGLGYGQEVYALINIDNQGFARFSGLAITHPAGGLYIKARLRYVSEEKAYLDLPFDRYYLEEKSAPLAEELYRQHTQAGKLDAYVIIRVQNGFAVIEGLYLADKRIEDLIRK
jgi:uncharacterized membrane-anchored protein